MKRNAQISLNIVIILLIAGFVWYMATSLSKEERTYVVADQEESQVFVSPYTKTTSFDVPETINRFELFDKNLYIIAGEQVYIYDLMGHLQTSFPVKPEVRDITVSNNKIYLLYPTFIEVYFPTGELVYQWEACSELSDYCSFTLAKDYVFVTDAANKNICQYTVEGNFIRFIHSPRDFIIPSYSFDIDYRNDTIYCVNAGRHLIETYTLDGHFIAAFGGPGGKEGFFAGCSNPYYITFTPDGELITSEKGNPRISSYERNGTFGQVLLNNRLLGGGTDAYGVKAFENKLFVSGKKTMKIYQHDPNTTNS